MLIFLYLNMCLLEVILNISALYQHPTQSNIWLWRPLILDTSHQDTNFWVCSHKKFLYPVWYPFWRQTLPDNIHATSAMPSVTSFEIKDEFSLLSKTFEWFGKRTGFVIFNRTGCHDWLCQAGVTTIILIWSFWTFLILFLSLRMMKMHTEIVNPSPVATLWGSGCQTMYCGSWWQSLEANKSNNGFPKWLQICFKTVGQNFHLRLSWKFRDVQSAQTVNIFTEISIKCLFWVPPMFNK